MRDWKVIWYRMRFSYCEGRIQYLTNEYQALSDCQRDITGHLEMLKMRGEDVLSEKELILLRAGENILISLTSVIEGMFMVDLNLY